MHTDPLYLRGACRVVGLGDRRPRPYVVLDTAGTWLHEDSSLEAARAWVDRREAPVPERRDRRPGRAR